TESTPIHNSNLEPISWNVRGLRKFIKLKTVMKRLKQYHSKVVFIQGTHLLVSEITKENMANNTYLKQNQILDPTGRFIIIQSSLMNLTLVNLYGPPVFTTVCSFLLQLFVVTGSDSSHLKTATFSCSPSGT
uniref:Endonuclease/exonuclease/phosphatase domain-containing protein n=1 Tax=Oreochromis niloticus TaxID=8128 RepID=A0A669FAF1_ORENI